MSQTRVDDASGTPVPDSPMQFTSSNFGSPNGTGSDLDGMGTRPGSTTDEKLGALLSTFVHFEPQIAQIPTLTNWMSRMDSHVTKTLEDFATGLTEREQNFSALTARMRKVETYAASASNVSGSARSWPALERVDGSTAAGSHGGHPMTTETQDADNTCLHSQAARFWGLAYGFFELFGVHSVKWARGRWNAVPGDWPRSSVGERDRGHRICCSVFVLPGRIGNAIDTGLPGR